MSVPALGGTSTAAPARAVPAAGINVTVDGFPVLFNETGPNAGVKIWTIGHHGYVPMTAPKISCVDVATGTACPDKNGTKSWPMPLNTQALPLDTSTPGDISTAQVPQFVTNPTRTKVFYPAVTRTAFPGFPNGSVGAGCLDLQNQFNCAYTPLAPLTNTAGQSNVNGLTGFVRSSANLFGVTTNGQVLCMNTTTQVPCSGQPYAGDVPPSEDAAGLGPANFTGTVTIVNDRVYTASNGTDLSRTTTPHPPSLTCFDTVTRTPCAGWGTKVLSNAPDAYISTAVVPSYSTGGTAVGVCAVTTKQSVQAPTVSCYGFTGAAQATPAGLAGAFPAGGVGSVVFQPLTFGAGGRLRTYFPFFTQDGTHPGSTLCYDWSTQATCTGFPSPVNHPTVNGGDVHDYAYVAGANCIYGTGDRRFLFSMNPTTGAAGC